MEKYLTPIAVLLGAVIIAAAFAWGSGGTVNTGQPAGDGQTADIGAVTTANEPYVGDPNAPATLAYFFDYQCPFCKQFEQTVMAELYATQVANGQLKIVYKDFQFLSEDSTTAALYGRAVWELYPNSYHAWHQAVMGAQDEEHGGFGDLPSIVAVTKAQVPGVDADKVAALMEQKRSEYQAAVSASRSEGAALGVNGTPTVIVGTKLLSGMSPADFYASILAELGAGG
jgi:protein-disulfide isomerase